MNLESPTSKDVVEFCRIPLLTVYSLGQDKRLPGFKVGKQWRFRKETINQWIKDQEKDALMLSVPNSADVMSRKKGH